MGSSVERALAAAHEAHWSRIVGTLVRSTRDLDLAEDAVQDAFESALAAWGRDGIPSHPEAWLITAARRKAIDRQRRDATLARKLPLLVVPDGEDGEVAGSDVLPDDRLRLVFTCCHPALAIEARVALSLRLVCGLDTATIARLFLVPEATMAARITRAKKKIAAAGIPYRVPAPDELPDRLPAVLSVIYLLFTAGHTVPHGEALVDTELTRRAIHLAAMMFTLLPQEPEVLGLYGLLRLSDARRDTRTDDRGRLVLLEAQDRSRWDAEAIRAGIDAVEASLRLSRGAMPGKYALEAAIEAVHMEARTYGETDWLQLLALYDLLARVAPSPLVELNRVVVLSKLSGPEAGLDALARLEEWRGGANYHLFAAARADLLRRMGRTREAVEEYRLARELTANAAEREFLAARIAELGDG